MPKILPEEQMLVFAEHPDDFEDHAPSETLKVRSFIPRSFKDSRAVEDTEQANAHHMSRRAKA